MRKKRMVLSEKRDIPILKFLWKWKLVTTAGIARVFFEGKVPHACYNRLLELKKGGFIERQTDRTGERPHWTLSQKGYLVIRDRIAGIKEDGFRSEFPGHDSLVTAMHLGDWLTESPPDVKFFSEQQLRRLIPSEYPSWVPSSDGHRCDGYWGIPHQGGTIPIALEVELSWKDSDDYEEVGSFYADQARVFRVLWLVQSESTANSIQNCIEAGTQTRSKIHNFVLQSSFLKNAWTAAIVLGPEKGKTISQFLNSICGRVGKPWEEHGSSQIHPLLDIRRSYVNPRSKRAAPISSEGHCRISTATGTSLA